jgi:4-amino-4-deoxy-L-arabinose transferase-like glycosyltransferase
MSQSPTIVARAPRWAAPLLALFACLLVASTWPVFGHIWDEPEHIAVGLALIEHGAYRYDDQHPPLARLAAAIGPYLAGARAPGDASQDGGMIGEEAGRQILYHSSASYDRLLTLARLGMLPFLVVLVFAVWQWTWRYHGATAAWLASAFLLSTPVILGHAGVVALDVPVTALCILSFYGLLRWLESPTLLRAALLGLAVGLAVSTKLSAVPFIGLAGLALLTAQALCTARARSRPPLRRRVGGAALALLIAFLTVIAVYGPHLIYLTTPDFAPSKALDALVGNSGWLHDAGYRLAARVRVPLGVQEVPLNILGVEWHNSHGHHAFLLGQTDLMGWWYFYPVALAVKTPLPLLLLGLTGLGLLAWRGWRERSVPLLAAPLCFTMIFVFCCSYSHINIGVRHVLVLYPLLAIGAAAATAALWAKWRGRAARAALAILLLWQFSTLASAYPDYLAYFNAFGGEHPERILVDSDLDWGQDLRRLSLELARRRVPSVSLAYMGTADLTREHLPPFTLLAPGQRASGWIAVDMLSMKEEPDGYAWLASQTPVTRVGKSIDLYNLAPR